MTQITVAEQNKIIKSTKPSSFKSQFVEQYLTKEEAASIMRCHPRSLYRMNIPYFKPAKLVLYRQSDIEKYIESKKVENITDDYAITDKIKDKIATHNLDIIGTRLSALSEKERSK